MKNNGPKIYRLLSYLGVRKNKKDKPIHKISVSSNATIQRGCANSGHFDTLQIYKKQRFKVCMCKVQNRTSFGFLEKKSQLKSAFIQ